MNQEIIREALKDALSHLSSAEKIIEELPTKERITAHIEMAKAYSMIAEAYTHNHAEQAPETVAETKKKKKTKAAQEEETITPIVPAAEPVVEQEAPVMEQEPEIVTIDEPNDTPLEKPQTEAESELEEPLCSIVDGVWIQFNRAVIENDYDYSAYMMEFVNREGVGAEWINSYMYAFSNGNYETVEALNDDNVMAFIKFVLDAIEIANQ